MRLDLTYPITDDDVYVSGEIGAWVPKAVVDEIEAANVARNEIRRAGTEAEFENQQLAAQMAYARKRSAVNSLSAELARMRDQYEQHYGSSLDEEKDPSTAIQADDYLDLTGLDSPVFGLEFMASLTGLESKAVHAYLEHQATIGDKIRMTLRIEKWPQRKDDEK